MFYNVPTVLYTQLEAGFVFVFCFFSRNQNIMQCNSHCVFTPTNKGPNEFGKKLY